MTSSASESLLRISRAQKKGFIESSLEIPRDGERFVFAFGPERSDRAIEIHGRADGDGLMLDDIEGLNRVGLRPIAVARHENGPTLAGVRPERGDVAAPAGETGHGSRGTFEEKRAAIGESRYKRHNSTRRRCNPPRLENRERFELIFGTLRESEKTGLRGHLRKHRSVFVEAGGDHPRDIAGLTRSRKARLNDNVAGKSGQ